jgi:hypothetical protein
LSPKWKTDETPFRIKGTGEGSDPFMIRGYVCLSGIHHDKDGRMRLHWVHVQPDGQCGKTMEEIHWTEPAFTEPPPQPAVAQASRRLNRKTSTGSQDGMPAMPPSKRQKKSETEWQPAKLSDIGMDSGDEDEHEQASDDSSSDRKVMPMPPAGSSSAKITNPHPLAAVPFKSKKPRLAIRGV